MANEHKFSDLIYEYFVSRIHFHYYKYGDSLPSIDTLCQQFGVGNLTVKAALRRMRQDGYISMGNGTSTKVIFRQTEQALTDHIIQFFSTRWNAFSDLYLSAELLFIPLLTEGIRRMEPQDLAYLSHLAKQTKAEGLICFYSFTLEKLKNPLALNLLWETSIFQGFPFVRENGDTGLYDAKFIQKSLNQIIADAGNAQWDGVYNGLLSFQRKTVKKQLNYFGERIQPIASSQQQSFVWRIYRERPQLCYSLAVRILHENFLGKFQENKFLPSYEKMASLYGVSVSTARRTVQLLNQLGAAHSINGKGTYIYSPSEYGELPDFTIHAVRRNLAFFLQAFELIFYTCEEVSTAAFKVLSSNKWRELSAALEGYLQSGHCELAMWRILYCIAQNSPLDGVREIYGKLYRLFLWGYPLKAAIKDYADFSQKCTAFTKSLSDAIKEKNMDQFLMVLKEFIQWEIPLTKKYLYSQGMQPDDLCPAPAIMLLL